MNLAYSQGYEVEEFKTEELLRYKQKDDPFAKYIDKVEITKKSPPVHEEWSMKTLEPGDGKTFPEKGDKVTIHYVGRIAETKEIFDTTLEEGREPFTFVIGEANVIEPWDYGILKMSLGELAQINFPKVL